MTLPPLNNVSHLFRGGRVIQYGTDVHNDTLANPHEIKVLGSRRIYFTEKI